MDPGLEVYSNPDHAWPPAAPFWPWVQWSGAGEWSDGTLWDAPPTPWLDPGLFHGSPPVFRDGSDLSPRIEATCVAPSNAFDAEVRLQVRVANEGPREAPSGAPIRVYEGKGGGTWKLLQTLAVDEAIPVDTVSATREVLVTRAEAERGIKVVVGGAEWTWPDCDHEDDALVWLDLVPH
jgi:hypothetical protein